MAPSGCRKSTEVTAQGGLRPKACVKSCSIDQDCRAHCPQARAIPHRSRLIRHVVAGGQPGQERLHCRPVKFTRVPRQPGPDIPANPVQVRLLGPQAVVPHPQLPARFLQQPAAASPCTRLQRRRFRAIFHIRAPAPVWQGVCGSLRARKLGQLLDYGWGFSLTTLRGAATIGSILPFVEATRC